MKATLISKENNEAKITIAISAEEFDAAIIAAYKANKDKFQVNGFRKGKAPMSYIEKMYGEGIFFEEAIDNCLNDAYPTALDELDLEPIGRPNIEFGEEKIEKHKGFEVTCTLPVKPEIEVKDYKGVKAEVEKYEVSEEDVNNAIQVLQNRNSRLVSAEKAAEDGDTVVLDYEGWTGDVQFEGGTAENQTLVLGSKTFIPGFEEQLIGAKKDDEVEVKVTFPEEYHSAELAGKDAIFKCKIHDVKVKEMPELDDEFAKDVSDFDTLEELKADEKRKLEENAKNAKEYAGKNAVMDKIYEANQFEVPSSMIGDEAGRMLDEFAQQLMYQGMNLETYCKYLNKTEDDMVQEFLPDAEKRVKTRLIMEGIVRQEGITASEEEIQKEIEDMAKMYNMEVEQVKAAIGGENAKFLKQDICNRKAMDMIYAAAEISEKEPKAAEAEEEKAE